MRKIIALVGNPNSGKTTLFNNLTKLHHHVGNFPGITVEKKLGHSNDLLDVDIIDLPGTYSLSPSSPEEIVTREFLLHEKCDLIIDVIDSTNLERSLYFSTHLMDTDIPVLLVLNMEDILKKYNKEFNAELLSSFFKTDIISISALKNRDLSKLNDLIKEILNREKTTNNHIKLSQTFEEKVLEISKLVPLDHASRRWHSIRLLERDHLVMKELNVTDLEINEIIGEKDYLEEESSERYKYIESFLKEFKIDNSIIHRKSIKIDNIITNKFLALPIFFLIIFLIYFLAIYFPGGVLTDLLNESVFGENGIPMHLTNFFLSFNTHPLVISIVVDGILAGISAVIGFLPQLIILFILLGILEDCGYFARIAFILDKIFSKFGLSGKSFIPLLLGTGCGVSGILASKTIENEHERENTIMTTTFMVCSAKLPIVSLITSVFFPSNIAWIVASLSYLLGIVLVLLSGLILKNFRRVKSKDSLIIELPLYHIPNAKNLIKDVVTKVLDFLLRAGTIIFIATIVIWVLQTFSFSFTQTDIENSMLSTIGKAISIIFKPLGFSDWRLGVASLSGLLAKENIVSTISILFGGIGYEESFALISSMTALSFLVFNIVTIPCVAAVFTMKKELGSIKKFLFAITYQFVLSYVIAFIIFNLGVISWVSVIAIIFIVVIILLAVRAIIQDKKREVTA